MCGRQACTLEADTLCRACEYKDASGKHKRLPWTKNVLEFKPSANLCPRDVLPCIVKGSKVKSDYERVLCAMMWGMIPRWHEGDYNKNKLATHNARLENLEKSELYAPAITQGKRCIVVCEGYYEWKATANKKEKKQPYYIYATQEKGVRADDPSTWKAHYSNEDGWKGIKLLRMAGIYNTFKTAEGEVIYSCSIITTDSSSVLSWLHYRSPVFLITEEDEKAWLDKDLSTKEVMQKLSELKLSKDALSWHAVSTKVNKVQNKSDDCRKEIQLIKAEKNGGPTGFMASWLKKGSAGSSKRKSTDTEDNDRNDDSDNKDRPLKIPKKE